MSELDPCTLNIGDPVSRSSVGPGTVTGITDANYPQVNHQAVVWLERPDGLRFDPYNSHGGSCSATRTWHATPPVKAVEQEETVQPDASQRRVVCAAIRSKRGHILCGPRHYDSIMQQLLEFGVRNLADWAKAEDGFVDQHGKWMNRYEALTVARAAGQILHRCPGDERELFSENLY